MATKMCFIANGRFSYLEKILDYEYFGGFAASQRKKCVASFHKSIGEAFPGKKILEVSSKSDNPFGIACSAFHLNLDGHPFECVFQASKVFQNNISFPEIIDYTPKDAKHFIRDQNLRLIGFRYQGKDFPSEPKTLFYDYLYCKALLQADPKVLDVSKVKEYDIFTDIEFNEKKQLNCQARSLAIFKYLLEKGKLDEAMASPENFSRMVYDDAFRIIK